MSSVGGERAAASKVEDSGVGRPSIPRPAVVLLPRRREKLWWREKLASVSGVGGAMMGVGGMEEAMVAARGGYLSGWLSVSLSVCLSVWGGV